MSAGQLGSFGSFREMELAKSADAGRRLQEEFRKRLEPVVPDPTGQAGVEHPLYTGEDAARMGKPLQAPQESGTGGGVMEGPYDLPEGQARPYTDEQYKAWEAIPGLADRLDYGYKAIRDSWQKRVPAEGTLDRERYEKDFYDPSVAREPRNKSYMFYPGDPNLEGEGYGAVGGPDYEYQKNLWQLNFNTPPERVIAEWLMTVPQGDGTAVEDQAMAMDIAREYMAGDDPMGWYERAGRELAGKYAQDRQEAKLAAARTGST